MATAIDQLDLMDLPIEDRAFGADPEPWFAQARARHPWLAKFAYGYLVHGHHEIRDLIAMDDKLCSRSRMSLISWARPARPGATSWATW